ncbi:hypothetical protein EPA93_19785 [Ktedonosporobacter rubrisoli]|uniref:VCBS repeat-containing protein n=1 Tax=Ktedonosporobacter rubrisoli TaxID=2509675 RepID=A0A4P6JS09_KTERU|nr:hypothetical protein [Ktedonosporobacter rubrisoli]QBD78115.1 hypothetical protein EPA93_19785 [Ktedonosporobacter rubrisoli]
MQYYQAPHPPRTLRASRVSQAAAPTTRPAQVDTEEENSLMQGADLGYDVVPFPRSAIRYTTTRPASTRQAPDTLNVIVRRRSRNQPPTPAPTTRHRRSVHPLFYMGSGMLLLLLVWIAGTWVIGQWQSAQINAQYGYPRLSRCFAVVGHHDSDGHPSFFEALNLNGQVIVIELPGGDATHALTYLGPQLIGTEQDHTPVSLQFRDVNGDGKPDMVIVANGQLFPFVNDNGRFRPAKPGEQLHL